MPKQQQPEIAIEFEPLVFNAKNTNDSTAWYRIRFLTVSESGDVRNPHSGDAFSDLEFQALCDWRDGVLKVFGWEVEYRNVYSVDLQRAERMVKLLKRVAKIEDKLVVRPTTFGGYVAVIAAALGVKRYVRVEGADRGWHTENEHTFHPIKFLASAIDSSIEDAREKLFPKPVEPVAFVAT